jgi:hypothetical protein
MASATNFRSGGTAWKRALVVCAAALAILACVMAARALPRSAAIRAEPPGTEPSLRPRALTEHVVIISVDGLRPDAIDRFDPPHMRRLRAGGRVARAAETVFPSSTLPAHVSMLTGLAPAQHRVEWNELLETDTVGPVPATVLQRVRRHGLRSAAFLSKPKLRHLISDGTIDHLHRHADGFTGLWAAQIERAVKDYLETHRPSILLVHIGDPDYIGHVFGWMSLPYGHAVRRADAAIEEVLESADQAFGPGRYTVILTADHGGSGRDHGSESEADTRVPWILWGRGVRGSGWIERDVRLVDTAPTVLRLLGLDAAGPVDGRPVAEALEIPGSRTTHVNAAHHWDSSTAKSAAASSSRGSTSIGAAARSSFQPPRSTSADAKRAGSSARSRPR